MDMLLVSAMSQEPRESQHLADVTQEYAEGQGINDEVWTLMDKRPETFVTPHR